MGENDKTYGVVLEGGGAKGAYQIGAWKALRELDVKIKGVVGTSVGALNGVMMAQDDFDAAFDFWKNVTFSQVIDVKDDIFGRMMNKQVLTEDLKEIKQLFIDFFKNNGFDITPMRESIHRLLDEEKVRSSGIDYGLVTISLSDSKNMEVFVEDIPEGLLEDYLLASAYLPVFKSEKLHGKRYLDGGFYNNLPIKMLLDKNYKDIIVIRIRGLGHIPKYVIPEDVKVTYIDPAEYLGGTLDLMAESTEYKLNLGYYDTMRVFKELTGVQYYLNLDNSEINYLEKFFSMPKRIIKWLRKAYGHEELTMHRDLVENVLPQLAKEMDLGGDWTYKKLYGAIYELALELLGADRFKIYHEDNLSQTIEDMLIKACDEEETNKDTVHHTRFQRAILYLCRHWC